MASQHSTFHRARLKQLLTAGMPESTIAMRWIISTTLAANALARKD
jgi:hypothetical protein